MKVVHVTWIDPGFAQPGWMTKGEFTEWVKDGLPKSDSVGFLAHESDTLIVLIQSIGETQVADGIKISRSAIEKISEIAEVPITLDLTPET